MHRFYVENITSGIVNLPESEAKHAVQVLRLTEGSIIALLDGKGNKALATLTNLKKKSCDALVTEIQTCETPKRPLILAVAPPKSNDRWNFILEKCQELGVTEIVPLKTFHSERKNINLERNLFALIAALKQSGAPYLCKLGEMQNFSTFLQANKFDNAYLAWVPENNGSNVKLLSSAKGSSCIIIGPEGDFSEEEVSLAKEHNFTAITMGTDVLRTETACIFAAATHKLGNL